MAHAAPSLDDLGSMHMNDMQKRVPNGYLGCFSSSGSLDDLGSYMYQASGYCLEKCSGQAITALTGGDTCLCGDIAPSLGDKVDNSKCSINCNGYPVEKCGGDGFYTVYATDGQVGGVEYADGGSTSSSSSADGSTTEAPSSTGKPSVVSSTVAGGSTVIVTIQPTSDPQSTSSLDGGGGGGGDGGTNTAGIAAGVVVGVVAFAGLIAGLVFCIRRKKQKEAEEEFRQKNQVSDFMRGSNERKPPGTGYSGLSDQRLDPEAGARRNSVGSLADNQDYSRRILRVANPDSS